MGLHDHIVCVANYIFLENLAESVSCGQLPFTASLAAMRDHGRYHTTANGALRTLLNLVVLVTFTLQAFLVQTHLHNLPVSLPTTGTVTASAPASKAPLDIDKCFLCQEYVHGGIYLTPAAAAVLPPSAVISLLPRIIETIAAARPQSHNWMGRAPPRV